MSISNKEVVDLRYITDTVAYQLSDVAAHVVSKHQLSEEIYVIITSKLGLESDIFTAPFQASTTSLQRLSDIGNLKTKASVAEHIELIASHHPGVSVILDQTTAIKLSQDSRNSKKKISLIDYEDGHCLLTGLNVRGIDVYIAGDMDVIRVSGDFRIINFKE